MTNDIDEGLQTMLGDLPEYQALWEHKSMRDWNAEFSLVAIGNGFEVKSLNKEHLEKHGLLGKGALHFMNEISILVDEKKDELSEEEWNSLEYTLNDLSVTHQDGELYYFLLHAYGAEAMNFAAWTRFSMDSEWKICLKTFASMPTNILEEYGRKMWKERVKTLGDEGIKKVFEVISARKDIYGELPIDMTVGILFEN